MGNLRPDVFESFIGGNHYVCDRCKDRAGDNADKCDNCAWYLDTLELDALEADNERLRWIFETGKDFLADDWLFVAGEPQTFTPFRMAVEDLENSDAVDAALQGE